MNTFINSLNEAASRVRTENGAATFSTTLSPLVDLFSLGGAYRTRSENEAKRLFALAFDEDRELATKCLFYIRDVRGGQGERKFFRTNLTTLFDNITDEQIAKLSLLVAEYGRWDDLLTVYDRYAAVRAVVKTQFITDLKEYKATAGSISLLAKWMPSINTSSKETVALAKRIAKDLGLSHKEYRQTLAQLRKHIDVVEKKMSSGNWEAIDLEALPSQARMKYKTALYKHLPDKMAAHIAAVEKGEEKVNTATLYPYQIVENLQPWASRYWTANSVTEKDKRFYETLWNNLPNYVEENQKAIVVADVSGSMSGTPISVALSLALYFAERNVGPFKNKFITFSRQPKLQSIPSTGTLYDRLASMVTDDWNMSTDIDKVFDLILDAAKNPNVKKEDVPTTIFIVSDMEFDSCANPQQTNFERAKERFEDVGLTLPQIVFWNVSARNDSLPVRQHESGVSLVSGCSPSVFSYAVAGTTPREFMLQVLNSERYAPVGEALK
jgi:hypothetical protein